MAQKSGPFDSTTVVEEIDGFPRGDRAITAEELAAVNAAMISDGVAKKVGDGFRVTADGTSGTALTVGSGFCMIRGRYAIDGSASTLDVEFSEDDRTIIIAQRLDVTVAETAGISKIALTSPGQSPTETATVKELWLARVVIPGGTVNITQSMITDLRGSEVCPWTVSVNAETDYDALPVEVRDGYTRIATENGGTGDAFTATVPNFNPATDQYANLAIRIVPAANSNANATLKVNGGAAYPLYKSDGDPCALYSLRAGIPVDVIFWEGKYFFKAGGSGAEYTKYATGTANVERVIIDGSIKGVKISTNTLTFKPRLLLVHFGSSGSYDTRYAIAVVFDAAGSPISTVSSGTNNSPGAIGFDAVSGNAVENGFSVIYNASTSWGLAYHEYRAYA